MILKIKIDKINFIIRFSKKKFKKVINVIAKIFKKRFISFIEI